MIKNLIFDMGGVLMMFDTDFFIKRMNFSGEEVSVLRREVFRSLEWARMDRGTMTEEEAAKSICARTPEHLHSAVRALLGRWERPIVGISGMEDLLKELKEKGYHLYLLSNASLRQHEYWTQVPGHQYFEDTLISADVGLVKPQPEIYTLACEKFRVKPEECLFIDDLPLNAEGAFFVGMQVIIFHGDTRELRRELKKRSVL